MSQAVARAVAYLEQAQADDGSFSASSGPGVTAIVTTALLRSGRTPQDPVVARSLTYLEKFRHDNGGIFQDGSNHKNYETSIAIVCFKEANRDGKYSDLLAAAENFCWMRFTRSGGAKTTPPSRKRSNLSHAARTWRTNTPRLRSPPR
jgi:squalene-hopene/tetraprenyl-beta-curcumene cyclase